MTRLTLIHLVMVAVFCAPAIAQQEPAEKPITIDELKRRQVVGELGVPLGTAVEARAIVISGRELGGKGDDSIYLLKVTHVDGKELEQPRLMEFSVPGFVNAEVANDWTALYEMRTGKKPRSVSSEQMAELEKGYVGKIVNLAVYEVGYYSGMPWELPRGAPIVQSRGFHFATYLRVLVDRAVEKQKAR
ncbi:hypothetical protein [Aeoliella sp.]|uniref:hypothetical protein n=1 Tax=Aeoliella sp. TaxID=2795800 RepID=UPI003CCB994F